MYKLNAPVQLEVYLNVYDLNPSSNSSLYACGLGFYHTGIQIELKEWTFGGHPGDTTGVMQVTPKTNHPNFRETILLGKTTYSYREIYNMIDSIKDKFPGNSYHLIRKNCNTFTNCFCEALLHKPIPSWVDRMAGIGRFFMETSDFFAMKPYENRWETAAGVKKRCFLEQEWRSNDWLIIYSCNFQQMHYQPMCINNKHKCKKICASLDCVIQNAFVCQTCNNHHKETCQIIPYSDVVKKLHHSQGLNHKDIFKYEDFVENTFKMLIKSLQKQFANFRQMFECLNASDNIKNFYESLKRHKQGAITGRRVRIMMDQTFPIKNDFKLKSQAYLWTLSSEIMQLQKQVNSKLPFFYSVSEADKEHSLEIKTEEHQPLKQIEVRFRKYRQNILGGLLENSIHSVESLLKKDVYNIQLLYRASKKDFSAKEFHRICDGKTNTLTLVKTQFGKVAGGFTPVPWRSPSQWQYVVDESEETFIFGLSKSLKKFKFVPYKKQFMISMHKDYGPSFGDDLVIYDHANLSKGCYSNFPDCYRCKQQEIHHTKQVLMDFVGVDDHYKKFNLVEWEVYKISFSSKDQEQRSYIQEYKQI